MVKASNAPHSLDTSIGFKSFQNQTHLQKRAFENKVAKGGIVHNERFSDTFSKIFNIHFPYFREDDFFRVVCSGFAAFVKELTWYWYPCLRRYLIYTSLRMVIAGNNQCSGI